MPIQLTLRTAEQHEALHPRLSTLLRQIEALAARKPAAAVPSATRSIAETLLFDAQVFGATRKGLVEAAADLAGLAAQLGQALATLDSFEAAHSRWNAATKSFEWRLADTTRVPVARRRPQPPVPDKSESDPKRTEHLRRKIAYQIDAKYSEGYYRGYDDASNGREKVDVSHTHRNRIWPPAKNLSP